MLMGKELHIKKRVNGRGYAKLLRTVVLWNIYFFISFMSEN